MKKLIILLFVGCFAFCSCEEIMNTILDGMNKEEDIENIDENNGNKDEDSENEEGLEEEQPIEIFKSEQDMEAAINHIHIYLYNYIKLQSEIEKSIIINKDFRSVTPINSLYEEAWHAGFDVIEICNKCIRSLQGVYDTFEPNIVDKYLGKCFILAGFTYKNLFEHWGGVPIITPETTPDETWNSRNVEEVIAYTAEMLTRGCELINQDNPAGSAFISYEAGLLALSETYGYLEHHRGLESSKRVAGLNSGRKIIFELDGPDKDFIVYTSDHAELFISEFSYNLGLMQESGISSIDDLVNRWDPASYGYWSMLKRTKQFAKIIGCETHMEYLPIPKSIVEDNQCIMQNPGY